MSLVRGGGSGPASRRMLENAFGTGVMDELATGDQALLHGHLAPRAQAVGDLGGGRFGAGCHSSDIFHERQEPCQPTVLQKFFDCRHADEKNRGIVQKLPAGFHPHTERRTAL